MELEECAKMVSFRSPGHKGWSPYSCTRKCCEIQGGSQKWLWWHKFYLKIQVNVASFEQLAQTHLNSHLNLNYHFTESLKSPSHAQLVVRLFKISWYRVLYLNCIANSFQQWNFKCHSCCLLVSYNLMCVCHHNFTSKLFIESFSADSQTIYDIQ